MKSIIHRAASRGGANHGWLQAKHTFSFADYYEPTRMHFGTLRVLNDDIIAPAMGFGKHPHQDMEIITIPISGALAHQDSMGNTSVIKEGEIQVMSAGTGIYHSEYNHSSSQEINLLQIWVFPNKKGVTPRYQEAPYSLLPNQWQEVVSPGPLENGLWIHQQAWFTLGRFDAATTIHYTLKGNKTGVYLFVIAGEVEVDGALLSARDGMGITSTEEFFLTIHQQAFLLVMEVAI